MSNRRVTTTVERLELIVSCEPEEVAAVIAALPRMIGGRKRIAVGEVIRVRQLVPSPKSSALTRPRTPTRY
jgi:hypothetical protein